MTFLKAKTEYLLYLTHPQTDHQLCYFSGKFVYFDSLFPAPGSTDWSRAIIQVYSSSFFHPRK